MFSLNKWQYRDEYIIVLREKNCKKNYDKKTAKKWQEWYSNPCSPAAMLSMLTTEPLGHLVTAADQAYFIVTDVLTYYTVYEYSNIIFINLLLLYRNKFIQH